MMQHYGAPTRLLDFSFSIGAALFFAFEERGVDSDRCIWAINYKSLIENAFWKLHINQYHKGGNSSPLSENEAEELAQSFSEDIVTNKYNFRQMALDEAEKCIRNQEEAQIGNAGIIPIEAPGNNRRLVSQNGLFLFSKNFAPFEENLCKAINISIDQLQKGDLHFKELNYESEKSAQKADVVKIIFKAEKIWNVDDILNASNISARNIYPDITGIAKSTRYGE